MENVMYCILHISDIHWKQGYHPKPSDKIIESIRSLVITPVYITIAITGDIAYSGKNEQYENAREYFNRLKDDLVEEFDCNCTIIACPGNHDCDFSDDNNSVRDILIEKISTDVNSQEYDSLVIDMCLKVQSNFFNFISSLNDDEREPCLAWQQDISYQDGTSISFLQLNSAWMSRKNEEQGTLVFPISQIPQVPNDKIRITLIHHPYNWFRSENARELRHVLENISDIILTGHEHHSDSYSIMRSGNATTSMIEGGIFSDPQSPSFNFVMIDNKSSKYAACVFIWSGDKFILPNDDPDWLPFVRANKQTLVWDMLTQNSRKFLEDPGIQLSHPKKKITLDDIYVPPDLKTYKHAAGKNYYLSNIPSNHTIDTLLEDRYVYLLGTGQCGKTTLAKIIFTRALYEGKLPIMILEANLINEKQSALRRLCDKEIEKVYKSLSSDKFWREPKERRVIIIDSFSEIALNDTGKNKVIFWLKKHFGSVYLLGGDMTQIEELVAMPEDDGALNGFKRYEILPFGHELRDKLIAKWLTLGQEYQLKDDELVRRLNDTAKIVNSILGNNLLPSYPIYILIILQQLEAGVALETHSGSYGYLYEYILTIALNSTSDSPEDIDAKHTYLSELAWQMFRAEHREIDEEKLLEFSKNHSEKYHIAKPPDQLMREILDSLILQPYFGSYRFCYRFFYYYFIARYLRDNLEEAESKSFIDIAVKELYREDYANIIIFVTYLTKNKSIIYKILHDTKQIFSNVKPCDLSNHVKFVNRLQDSVSEIIPITYEDVDTLKARNAKLKAMDYVEKSSKKHIHPMKTSAENQSQLDLYLSLNKAIKSLQILGQILRNFSGSLKSDLKFEITKECFDLALRVLNSFCDTLERHLDVTLKAVAGLFDKDLSKVPKYKRVDDAKKLIFLVTELMCLATLQRISDAVGSDKLIRTYQELEKNYDNRATRFVQLSLRLDHFKSFPQDRVNEIWREVKDDEFAATLLKFIIVNHFRYFPRSYRLRQSICDKLGIPYKKTIPRKTTEK